MKRIALETAWVVGAMGFIMLAMWHPFFVAVAITVISILAGWFRDKGQPDPGTAKGKEYYR
jgi:hypothetical protein